MSYYGGFPPYIPVGERKRKSEKAIKKLKKKNPSISPVVVEGRNIAKSWWGKAWAKNLENYADYSNRIGRGRSYVRHGSVLDLKITKGNIKALVLGSRREPYNINIKIKPINKKMWKNIMDECLGKIESIEELTEGRFPKSLESLFTSKGKGLFPSPSEIDLDCDCPDGAIMCKHIAAALYGVAVCLDNNPEMFFTLRGVNINDLISQAVSKKAKSMLKKSEAKGRRVIEDTEIFDIFGIDTEDN